MGEQTEKSKKAKLHAQEMKEKEKKNNEMLEKTMLQWGQGDAKLMEHTIIRIWGEVVAERRASDAEAAKLEEKKRLKAAHDRKMKGVLMKWESGNASFLKHL